MLVFKMAGHGHGHGCCSSEHQHDDNASEAERGNLYSLYKKIDIDKVQCLNEAADGSCQKIFKPWHERLDKTKYVESDVDEELLLNIPKLRLAGVLNLACVKEKDAVNYFKQKLFTGSVKLKGVIIIGGEDDSHPSVMKLYKNRPSMTFDDTGCEADQEFQLSHDYTGDIEYATKVARFNSVTYLSIHFPKNFGAETTRIYYIGLKGDFSEARRHEVTVTTYEARANPVDHKTNLFDSVSHEIH